MSMNLSQYIYYKSRVIIHTFLNGWWLVLDNFYEERLYLRPAIRQVNVDKFNHANNYSNGK